MSNTEFSNKRVENAIPKGLFFNLPTGIKSWTPEGVHDVMVYIRDYMVERNMVYASVRINNSYNGLCTLITPSNTNTTEYSLFLSSYNGAMTQERLVFYNGTSDTANVVINTLTPVSTT